MISQDPLIFTSNLASISEPYVDRLIHEEPPLDNKDPYPWLDPQDPRRFQTDRELVEQLIDLSESSLIPKRNSFMICWKNIRRPSLYVMK